MYEFMVTSEYTAVEKIAKRVALNNNFSGSQSVCNFHEQLSVCL